MTCVCKECEGKMKIVQEQRLQLNVIFDSSHKDGYLLGGLTFGGENKNLVEVCWGRSFQTEGDDQIFETYCSITYSSEHIKFT